MSEALTVESIRWALGRLSEKLNACATELNELDGALGDGDLGVNLSRASARLEEDAPNFPEDVGMALLRWAQAFTRVSASTYGTLLATGLMAGAKLTKGRTAVPWTEMPAMLEAALAAMSARGKGQLGDKTVLDALDAARQATAGLSDPAAMAVAARDAIIATVDRVRNLPFRQGRARIFGEKGLGRDDPGMIAFLRIVEALIG